MKIVSAMIPADTPDEINEATLKLQQSHTPFLTIETSPDGTQTEATLFNGQLHLPSNDPAYLNALAELAKSCMQNAGMWFVDLGQFEHLFGANDEKDEMDKWIASKASYLHRDSQKVFSYIINVAMIFPDGPSLSEDALAEIPTLMQLILTLAKNCGVSYVMFEY